METLNGNHGFARERKSYTPAGVTRYAILLMLPQPFYKYLMASMPHRVHLKRRAAPSRSHNRPYKFDSLFFSHARPLPLSANPSPPPLSSGRQFFPSGDIDVPRNKYFTDAKSRSHDVSKIEKPLTALHLRV